eukprot:SAG31_NODE_533_length_14371_cov_6.455367_21_plen_173_part_00
MLAVHGGGPRVLLAQVHSGARFAPASPCAAPTTAANPDSADDRARLLRRRRAGRARVRAHRMRSRARGALRRTRLGCTRRGPAMGAAARAVRFSSGQPRDYTVFLCPALDTGREAVYICYYDRARELYSGARRTGVAFCARRFRRGGGVQRCAAGGVPPLMAHAGRASAEQT